MDFFVFLSILTIISLGIFTPFVTFAQIDPLNDIEFLQTGELNFPENKFHISNELFIREFFKRGIVRVSGQTIE